MNAPGVAEGCVLSGTNASANMRYRYHTGSTFSYPPIYACMRVFRHVSFVDCPGHDILMATMLNGAAVMDAALLLIAGNEPCPQPQTSEHLAAVQIMKLREIVILQNKMDLIKESAALEQHAQIREFVRGTPAEHAPIIPISGQLRYNIDCVLEYLCTRIPVPVRDFMAPARMIVIRSFDVNKPGAEVGELKGGVAGGSILAGVLRVGDAIEIRPGITSRGPDGDSITCRPLFSRVVSLFAENNDLKFAVPGGLIGVGTCVDPTLCRADRLVGQVLGLRGTLPGVFIEIDVQFHLLRRLLGVRSDSGQQTRVTGLERGEILMVNIGSFATGGKVTAIRRDCARIALSSPACTETGEKLALSRRIDRHWRLIGWGAIMGGVPVRIVE